MKISLRPLTMLREFSACARIQREVWGELEAVPDHMLLTVQKNGGIIVGAFDEDLPEQPLVGFVFGFLARSEDGRLKHASHMAAVLPTYRDSGLGEQLKWAQREQALAQGLDLMTWTFDPLISRNAYLNIAKLGAVCRTYVRNIYGPEPEDPHGELPSDRFRVDWWLKAPTVVARRAGQAQLPTASALLATAPLVNPDPLDPVIEPIGERFLLRIPLDSVALSASDIVRARAWRYQLRALAEAAFAAGYQVCAYARHEEAGFYLLER